jgi:hypothetical protein
LCHHLSAKQPLLVPVSAVQIQSIVLPPPSFCQLPLQSVVQSCSPLGLAQDESVNYPLLLSFKLIALAPQVFIRDADGQTICYVKQKLFKLKEHVQVFTDESKQSSLADIKANKVLDWSARYNFASPDGSILGSVGRKGMRSLFKAHYETFVGPDERHDFDIQEENALAKVGDTIFGSIPILGALSGYLFHPKYLATRSNGTPAMRLTKQAAMWEGKFIMEKLDASLTPEEELSLMLSYLMLVMLERARG